MAGDALMTAVKPIKNGERFSHRDTAMFLFALGHACFPDRPEWLDIEIARHAVAGRTFVTEVEERTLAALDSGD